MNATAKREKLRGLLGGTECLVPASVYDPISLRIAEEIGYEFGMLGGSVASLTILGAPDIVVMTLSEFAEQTRRTARAGNLPVMADADHGYGNALNVMRTVEELEAAGVSGLSIEDTVLPVAFGSPDKPQLLSIEEGVGKMKAAIAARQDKSLIIVGRSSSIGITGIEDTIARAKAYEAAGVDVFFGAGVKTRADLEALTAAIRIPLVVGVPPAELSDMAYLGQQRVRVCIQPHLPIVAATQAIYETMKALRNGTAPKDVAGLASADLMKKVTHDADYRGWIKGYLGG